MRKFLLAACAAAALLSASGAHANDTMAELKTGGLVFVRSDAIEMASEDLYISPEEVRVAYVFRNTSDEDVESIVAFPMPEISGHPFAEISVPNREVDNMFGFSVEMDGKPLSPQLEQKAYAANLDVSQLLRDANVPLNPFSEETAAAIEKLPAATKADFIARGILILESFDVESGLQELYTPVWSLRATYWWRATFLRGRDISVRHSYRPSVGGTVALTFMEDGKAGGPNLAEYRDKYCLDEALLKGLERRAAAHPDKVAPFMEQWISYILTTGANWSGPIGKFRLVIDKGAEANLVSFCGTDVKKIGPTTFEMVATDFYPERDIDVLVMQRLEN